ncbi:MAG TPA: hypothetical protein VK816_04480 [Jatrophihabitantaceae bacterium]|jgi:hypothetical protein|nr:hypothetical protein [Jatrophihabitantaceae bacterium]
MTDSIGLSPDDSSVDDIAARFFGESPFATPLAGEAPSAPFFGAPRPVEQPQPEPQPDQSQPEPEPQSDQSQPELEQPSGPYRPRYNAPRQAVIKVDPAALANRPNSAADGWLLPPGGPATGRPRR